MSEKRRKRHSPEQIVRKLRDADAMLKVGKDMAAEMRCRFDVGSFTADLQWSIKL